MVNELPWLLLTCGVIGALIGWYGEGIALRWTPHIIYRPSLTSKLITALLTFLLFMALALRFRYTAELPCYLLLGAAAVLLSGIDLKTLLLPNRLVWPLFWLGTGSLTVASVAGQSWSALIRALLGALVLFALYFFLALISPAGLGMGDVKLAAVLGLYSAYIGWGALFLTAFLSFFFGALVAAFLAVTRRGQRPTHFPFGPSMAAGSLVSILGSVNLLPLIFPAFLS